MPFQIKRFTESVHELVDTDSAEKILNILPPYESSSTPVQTARWIQIMMDHMVNEVGVDQTMHIMEACGEQCIGKSLLEKARKLKNQSKDIDDLITKLNESRIGGGALKREGALVYASYDRCYCGSVSKTRQLISAVYCQCSCGWYKRLFEALFEKSVEVELIGSIVNGADACRFVIYI